MQFTKKKLAAACVAALVAVAAASSSVTYLVLNGRYEAERRDYERQLEATVDATDRMLDLLDERGLLDAGDDATDGTDEGAATEPEDTSPEPQDAPEASEADTPESYDRSEQPRYEPDPVPEEPDEVSVPDVVGLSEADARDALDVAGLPVAVSSVYSATVPEGHVVSYSPQGTVWPGTTISLSVSAGPEP